MTEGKKSAFEGINIPSDELLNNCIHCGLCQRGCPTGAIEVVKEDLSWSINRLACITCGYCSENCPVHCLTMDSHYSATTVTKVKDVFISARVSNNTENN